LERSARLVDIAYCVGNTGISKPFSCVSRCKDFPSLVLATAWNTGPLLSDSCGYIAVDHGRGDDDDDSGGASDANDMPHGPAIVVAFRGTYSITNTIIDLSTVPQEYVPYPTPDDGDGGDDTTPTHRCDNCTVHMGFLASWANTRTIVIPELQRLRAEHPDYPIHLIGHSLGGAVAALAALELRTSLGWGDDVSVTTFGEPRVGNAGLCRFIDAVFDLADDDTRGFDGWRYRRVTHAGDPVPLLPLGEWGYQSHAGEIFISKPSLSPSPSDLRACAGDADQECIAGEDGSLLGMLPWPVGRSRGRQTSGSERARPLESSRDPETPAVAGSRGGLPTRFKLWHLLSSHRDYFWRLGLCVPGGDPFDWGRERYGGREEL
jgi:pimeloyl-ACP methyl ester carboxylesterase